MGGDWQTAFRLEELPVGAAKVFKAKGKQAAVFRLDDDTVYAVDNLCPHEGYPLVQGYVKQCLVTCAWHNYKFDLRDGRCVMGEEAVRSFPVRLADGDVQLDMSDPDPAVSIPQHLESLDEGLVEYSVGRVARDVVRLIESGMPPEQLVLAAARFDADRAEYGSTHALAVAADALRYLARYSGAEAAYPIMQVMDLAAEPHTRLPRRTTPEPSIPGSDPLEAGARLSQLVEAEDAVAAEALLRGALGWGREVIEPWLFRLCSDHFLDFGHALIYQVKVFDLLDQVGWQHAPELLPAHLFRIINGTREDTLPPWAAFTARLDSLEPLLPELMGRQKPNAPPGWNRSELVQVVLEAPPRAMFAQLVDTLEAGTPFELVLDAVSLAASERLLRFDVAIDKNIDVQAGWLDVTHLLTYANAVRHALKRYRDPRVIRLLMFAARFVNNARPLDKKAADVPAGRDAIAELGSSQDAVARLEEAIEARQPARAVGLVTAYLESQQSIEPLRVALEDFALKDPAVRPIIVAHLTKTTFAAFEESARLAGDPQAARPLQALVNFLASPVRERRVMQRTYEAINFVVHGKVPRTLT